MDHIELLAPAGGWEALTAVVEAGADAVYFSPKRFAMRQHGAWLNFSEESVGAVVRQLHQQGCKAYLALNNLLTADELALLADWLPAATVAAPDALIVQDLGLLHRLPELCPGIPVHASTMMNVHAGAAARWLQARGVTRIIASRDITLAQAAQLGREAGLEVEYFVHGDMCVAVGGQCFHSGIAAGYSANRGKCLKSCRWAWQFIERAEGRVLAHLDDHYLLARQDLCLYHQLPAIFAMGGIHCLKIEGRARPAAYLAPIVAAYREALDRYQADPAGYRTDFDALRRLRSHTLREVGSGHAFARPGVGSSDLSGRREPRFFSIAVEEPPLAVRSPAPPPAAPPAAPPELAVRVATLAAARAALASPCQWLYLGGERWMSEVEVWPPGTLARLLAEGRRRGKRLALVTPRLTGERELAEMAHLVREVAAEPPDAWLASNPGALQRLREETDLPLQADYGFNVWNPEAAALLAAGGVTMFTAGLELTLAQVANLADAAPLPMECVVHGSLPGMVLEYCPIGVHLSRTTREDPCPGPCQGRGFALVDKLGQRHWLEADQYCRTHLFMAKDLCALGFLDGLRRPNLRRWRIEGVLYTPEELRAVIDAYAQAGAAPPPAPRGLTAGAFASPLEAVSEPCQELPTDWIIRYDAPSG